jgi:hypothetical protein
MPHLATLSPAADLIELGGGYGRDARFFCDRGFRVRGVELALERLISGRSQTGPVHGSYTLAPGDALGFLENLGPRSADAVHSNMFYDIDLDVREHRALFAAVRRMLRGGGMHLYSARSTSDPWFGRGRNVGPDRFELEPDGVTIRIFSRAYVDLLAGADFEGLERLDVAEGSEDVPVRLLYVIDRVS